MILTICWYSELTYLWNIPGFFITLLQFWFLWLLYKYEVLKWWFEYLFEKLGSKNRERGSRKTHGEGERKGNRLGYKCSKRQKLARRAVWAWHYQRAELREWPQKSGFPVSGMSGATADPEIHLRKTSSTKLSKLFLKMLSTTKMGFGQGHSWKLCCWVAPRHKLLEIIWTKPDL